MGRSPGNLKAHRAGEEKLHWKDGCPGAQRLVALASQSPARCSPAGIAQTGCCTEAARPGQANRRRSAPFLAPRPSPWTGELCAGRGATKLRLQSRR